MVFLRVPVGAGDALGNEERDQAIKNNHDDKNSAQRYSKSGPDWQ